MRQAHRTRAAAQRASLFFFIAGLLASLGGMLVSAQQPQQGTFIALGILDLAIAALLRVLPWERWHRHALLVAVPVAFIVIGLFHAAGATTPSIYPIFFILIFIWVGLSLPPRAALLLTPLTIAAYIIPLWLTGQPRSALESAMVVVPACVLIGEVVARAVHRLHEAQDELEQRVAERTAQLQAANEAIQNELAERKQVEMALRESELRFRQLAEHIHVAFWLLEPRTPRLLYISPAYEAIWQRSCASLYAQPASYLEAVHPDDYERVVSALERQRQGAATDEEYRILRPDGSVRWISERSFPVTDTSGKVERIARVAQEITDRKRLEAQLLQAQKLEAIGRLAGGIAHDFNNLLTAIGGYTELLSLSLPDDSALRSDLEEIQRAVQRATNLTSQLLAFARKQIIEPRILNLNDLIVEMDKLLRRVIGEDIELVTRPAPDLGQVKVDPGQIEQLLVNLAVNARDAMPEGGKLTIETHNVFLNAASGSGHGGEQEAYVLLAVSDTGVGMDAEVKAHAFEPFFTTKEQGKGTGLGLATCYGIAKQHGGNITVYSEVGQGTTFNIYLPQAEGPASPLPSVESQTLAGGNEVVLLVEDEAAVRALAARVLREHGYTVLEASDGAEAVRVAAIRAPEAIDLLVTDVVMPQLGGKAVANQISSLYSELKVLFISGYTDTAIVHHGRLDEGVAFLHKPFTPADLIRKVREVLDG